MIMCKRFVLPGVLIALLAPGFHAFGAVQGWLSWRGPHQNGSSEQKNLPVKLDPAKPLWKVSFSGASTPVIADGRLYIMGYEGSDSDIQEVIACFDAETGQRLWHHGFNDFLSDIIYNRYATSSPVIDPDTGNIYIQGTQGIIAGFTRDGKRLWEKSMMELYGKLTFPNGRTTSPVIDRDLVITHGITANWGAHGPGGDRFYAFDKTTGDLVWASQPGERPKDSSYSHPFLGWQNGKRVLYGTTGDGSVVCVNARTGDPLWRIRMAKAGINASVLVHNNERVIAIYGTPYEPGQMVAMKIPQVDGAETFPVVVAREDAEIWSQNISTSTSSPILVGDTIYVVAEKGDLIALDARTGEIAWSLKIGIEQRNACPLYADGRLYVPILDDPASKGSGDESGGAGTKGGFYVIEPGEKEGKILTHVALDGRCFGSPTPYRGKIYIQTTQNLYCFGTRSAGREPVQEAAVATEWPQPGPAAQLQIIPADVLVQPGEKLALRVRALDKNGFTVVENVDPAKVKWESYIPATARVRAEMKASFDSQGRLVADNVDEPSAGAFKATYNGMTGFFRGRVLPRAFTQDFESFELSETHATENVKFSYPPLPWIGARFKFEVRDKDGNKALTKTIDNKFFQRSTVFLGHPEMKSYTVQADVLSDGNRRKMSDVGVINQRYLIILKGNEQKLEVSSNLDRLRSPSGSEPPNFRWQPNVWYRLKTQVDVKPDGSGVIKAKAWKRDEPEPEEWTLTVPHARAHQSGSPGLFGFAPQDMRVYIDNVVIRPTENQTQ